MKRLQTHIKEKQLEFATHPFFIYLEKQLSLQSFLNIMSYLAFWVMIFQDVLRLNEERIKNAYVHKIARHHRIEDSGHEKWFLQDVGSRVNQLNIDELFGTEHQSTRDAAYSIISEVFNLRDEELRVVLLLSLESSGHIFFERTAKFSDLADNKNNLKYFSSKHLDVEKAHAIFEEEMERELFETLLSDEKHEAGIALINRVYAAFHKMFDNLSTRLSELQNTATVDIEKIG